MKFYGPVLPRDSPTCIGLLQTCGELNALGEGKRVHDHIIRAGLERITTLANGLISMYGKCGSVENAHRVFDNLIQRNVVSWNAVIATYIQNRNDKMALQLFRDMQLEGVQPNKVTFITVLSACASPKAQAEGKSIHLCVINTGLEGDVPVGSALVNMYGKCGNVNFARKVFDDLHNQDVVSWNGLMTMYVQHGFERKALQLFQRMQLEGLKPNKVTFIVVVNACTSLATLIDGKMIHANVVVAGLESDITVGNALISMYGRCCSPEEAQKTFENMPQWNVVSWNTMISTNAHHGYCEEAFQLFQRMQLVGIKPNEISYANVLSACTSSASLAQGKAMHASAVDIRLESEVVVANALLSMYSKCGSVEDAQNVFEKIQDRSVVSWNAIIAAYDWHEQGNKALRLFWQMQEEGVRPDEFTFATVISACASMGSLEGGTLFHNLAYKRGFGADEAVRSALVNMYGKCGSVENAMELFGVVDERNVVLWTAMIAAYAQQGNGCKALHVFLHMQNEGLKPTDITFVSMISACSHAGLLDEGSYFFSSMRQDHGIMPMVAHYGCLIDLYGRAGMLDAAEDIINKMPFQPGSMEWLTLLSACRIYGDAERGKFAAQHVLELHPEHSAAYISLSNIYASAGMWVDSTSVKNLMIDKCL